MPQQPKPEPTEPQDEKIDPSPKSDPHNYARFITQAQVKLQAFKPKYDKSIFEIADKPPVADAHHPQTNPLPGDESSQDKVGVSRQPPQQQDQLPVPVGKPGERGSVAEKGAARAAKDQQAYLEELNKELNKEENERKLNELISQMKELEEKVEKMTGGKTEELQRKIIDFKSTSRDIEDLDAEGSDVNQLLESLTEDYENIKDDIEGVLRKMNEAKKMAQDEQQKQEKQMDDRERKINEDLANVRRFLRRGEDISGVEQEYKKIIDIIRKKIQEEMIQNIQGKREELSKDLKKAKEELSKLERDVEVLNVAKENGRKLQEAIKSNNDIVSKSINDISDITVGEKLDQLRKASDEMNSLIKERIKEITIEGYRLEKEKELQTKMKECKNEYFVNLKNQTVKHIKITIDELIKSGRKNFNNDDIKERIYDQIRNSESGSTDLNCYIFLNIVEFILFMINPPEYKKKNKELNYNNVNTGFFSKNIYTKITEQADKLKNMDMLFTFIKRKRHLRDIDEYWLCEKI